MVTKFRRNGFRERSKVSSRVVDRRKDPLDRTRMKPVQARAMLFWVLLAVFALFVVGELARPARQPDPGLQRGSGVVAEKATRQVEGRGTTYLLTIDVVLTDGLRASDVVPVTSQSWEVISPGDTVEVAYDVDEEKGTVRISDVYAPASTDTSQGGANQPANGP